MKIVFLVLTIIFSLPGNHQLLGRWESPPSEKGNVTGVVFKPDNRLEAHVNKKALASGIYSYSSKDSILSFVDNGCDGAKATYKVIFFSNSDSIRFKTMGDSCEGRRKGMEKLVLGRVKQVY